MKPPNVTPSASEATATEANAVSSSPQTSSLDLTRLRLSAHLGAAVVLEKRVAVRSDKPPKHSFFRIHPAEEYQFPTRVLEFGDSRDTYLIAPEHCEAVNAMLRVVVLRLYVTLDGTLGLWPLAIPDPLRQNRWHSSALEIAHAAEQSWVRIVANLAAGAYDCVVALGEHREPAWPNTALEELIRKAFRDRVIASEDHPVLRALRGEL